MERGTERTPQYQVDAFAKGKYTGNPAAVVLLQGNTWPDDAVLLAVARENNLSETAYVIEPEDKNECWRLRWFKPVIEVNLCGHATLASAHVIFTKLPVELPDTIKFDTRSGILRVSKFAKNKYQMIFPAIPVKEDLPASLVQQALATLDIEKQDVVSVLRGGPDIVVVVRHWEIVARLTPKSVALGEVLAQNNIRGAIVTADTSTMSYTADKEIDFVSRFFSPQNGFPEDPATGSAHCVSTYLWAKARGVIPEELQKNQKLVAFKAKQLSQRGGHFHVELHTNDQCELKVHLIGECADFLDGMIDLEMYKDQLAC